jgi:hypothetical protein
MKNIFLIPTPKESRLWRDLDSNKLRFENISKPNSNECTKCSNEYVYITSDSKFVRDEYITDGIEVIKATPKLVDAQGLVDRRDWKKIIITTDPELIKDGVHPIGEEFLKWFVENPTCIKVEVVYGLFNPMGRQVDPNDLGQNHSKCVWKYKIITTKEEPKLQCKDCNDNLTDCTCIEDTVDMKQETLEEAADRYFPFAEKIGGETYTAFRGFMTGTKWQQERSYSEEDMKSSFQVGFNVGYNDEESPSYLTFEEWIKEYKKK